MFGVSQVMDIAALPDLFLTKILTWNLKDPAIY